MADPIVYVDTSDVRDGKLDQIKAGIKELVEFIDQNVPRAIAYAIYLNPEGTQMSVVQTHPDSESLEFHMEVGAAEFAKFKDLLVLRSIDLYGKPSARLMGMLERKAQMLGGATVKVHDLEAGFTRLAAT